MITFIAAVIYVSWIGQTAQTWNTQQRLKKMQGMMMRQHFKGAANGKTSGWIRPYYHVPDGFKGNRFSIGRMILFVALAVALLVAFAATLYFAPDTKIPFLVELMGEHAPPTYIAYSVAIGVVGLLGYRLVEAWQRRTQKRKSKDSN